MSPVTMLSGPRVSPTTAGNLGNARPMIMPFRLYQLCSQESLARLFDPTIPFLGPVPANMGFFSSCLLVGFSLFFSQCLGLSIPHISDCTADGCSAARAVVDVPSTRDFVHYRTLFPRSSWLDSNKIISIVAPVVGGLALVGILAIVLWYRRGNSAILKKEEGFEEIYEVPPVSARYIAPLPRVYAERWAAVVESTIPIPQPSVASPDSRATTTKLIISVPANEPPPPRSWKLKRVPVPRLSRLPPPYPTLARIRGALRTPRCSEFKRPPRLTTHKPKPPPSPLAIPTLGEPLPSSVSTGIPSALSTATPLTSRLSALINRIQSEYKGQL
ncbi:hypothetical protein B0H10DRAFT_671640 [Mycena sp. CBHHK59/15]|nr:hypothetical protein B0H10DRAFT_671640 [Mycena sp. CBHHK59/15]